MSILPANPAASSKPTRYVYDQFSFDPVAEMRHPTPQSGASKELHLRRAGSPAQAIGGRLLSSEIFSPDASEFVEGELQDLGRYAYFYSNHRGDVTSLLKHDGQSLHSYVYEEYGSFYDVNQSKGNSSNFIDPHNAYTFSGKEFDNETGLIYYGARYYDAWSGTWNSQDVLRGSIHSPETLHRYAFVKNNPVNFIDPDGMAFEFLGPTLGPIAEQAAETYVIDPLAQSLSSALSFDNSFSTPEIPVGAIGNIFGLPTDPNLKIPSTSINIKNQANINFDFIDQGYNLTGSDTLTGGLVTPNNNYGAGVHGDAGLVKDAEGYNVGAGGAVQVQKNGQILYQNAGFVGDPAVLNAFGATSAYDYRKQRLTQLNQQVIQSIQKAKDERVQRQKAYMAYMERLGLVAEMERLIAELESDDMTAELSLGERFIENLKRAPAFLFWEFPKGITGPVVKPVVGFTQGVNYSIINNYTYGFYGRFNDKPTLPGSGIGQMTGDTLTLLASFIEGTFGGTLTIGGGVTTGGGLILCPETAGAGCAAAGGGAAITAGGVGIVTHAGSVILYTTTKDKNYFESSGSSGGGGSKITNPTKSESPIWKKLQNYRDGIKTNGLTGKNKEYYKWDSLHNDIEVFNSRGQHIGSMDPISGKIYKPNQKTHHLDL